MERWQPLAPAGQVTKEEVRTDMAQVDSQPPRLPATLVALVVAITLGMSGCAEEPGQPGGAAAVESASSETGYQFSEDWFSPNIPVWLEVLEPLRGQPDVRYLEIGVYEGRSVIWMLENILTHPSARLTGIDLFPTDALLQVYLANLDRSGFAEKATTIRGSSQVELRNLAPESYDIIYVDGSHTADDVMTDAVLSWLLLREGGFLIFDDYGWSGYEDDEEAPDRRPLPADLRPTLAVDVFLTAHKNSLEVLHRGYQLIVQKKASPCSSAQKYQCEPFGDHLYLWRARVLYSPTTRQEMDLTETELDMIERVLESVELGETKPQVPPGLRDDPTFQALAARAGFTFEGPAG